MAMRAIFVHLALAVLVGAGCGSPGSGAADSASVEAPAATAAPALDPSTRAPASAGGSRSGFRPTDAMEAATGLPVGLHAKEIVRWRKRNSEARLGAALPEQGVMVALTRWGETTLGVFDVVGAKMIPLAKREAGALVVSQGGSRLAYLVREGPNPAKNRIEILDWRNGSSLIIEPATDDAVLGFALDGEGKQLSYATMNLRNSRSTHVTWRVGLLDLERQQARIAIDSAAEKSARWVYRSRLPGRAEPGGCICKVGRRFAG